MLLLEGFVITTLDTAVRLNRYLIEEVWQEFFGRFDVLPAALPASPNPRRNRRDRRHPATVDLNGRSHPDALRPGARAGRC